METALLLGWVLLMLLGWAGVWWTEKVKAEYWAQEKRSDHYLDLSKDSRLAQARSLAAALEDKNPQS
jgi:hypothetical protein